MHTPRLAPSYSRPTDLDPDPDPAPAVASTGRADSPPSPNIETMGMKRCCTRGRGVGRGVVELWHRELGDFPPRAFAHRFVASEVSDQTHVSPFPLAPFYFFLMEGFFWGLCSLVRIGRSGFCTYEIALVSFLLNYNPSVRDF